MAERAVSWRDRLGDEVTCVRCLEVCDSSEVDRLRWCRDCRRAAGKRATVRGWMIGGAGAVGLALWIWFVIEPSDLVLGGWLATVVAAGWIGSRVAREVLLGVDKFRNRRAAEAVPPASIPNGGEAPR